MGTNMGVPASPSDDYTVLKTYGHSPAKAAEIALDAKRGDYFSERYIAFVRVGQNL